MVSSLRLQEIFIEQILDILELLKQLESNEAIGKNEANFILNPAKH